jgi:hypothetical protein
VRDTHPVRGVARSAPAHRDARRDKAFDSSKQAEPTSTTKEMTVSGDEMIGNVWSVLGTRGRLLYVASSYGDVPVRTATRSSGEADGR